MHLDPSNGRLDFRELTHWHVLTHRVHLVVTYTDNNKLIRFYLNGTLTVTYSFYGPLTISASCSSYIGYTEDRYYGSGDLRLDASLRDYRVYKTPLRCARSTMADRQFGKVTLTTSTL